MEGSYREYHATAFTAAGIHPAEASEEGQRIRTAICSLMGLRPPPPQTPEAPGGDGGNDGARTGRDSTPGMDGPGRNAESRGTEGTGAEEVRAAGETRLDTACCGLPLGKIKITGTSKRRAMSERAKNLILGLPASDVHMIKENTVKVEARPHDPPSSTMY